MRQPENAEAWQKLRAGKSGCGAKPDESGLGEEKARAWVEQGGANTYCQNETVMADIVPLRTRRAMRDGTKFPPDGDLATTFAEEGASAKAVIAVIESRAAMRDCIRRSMQSAFSLPVMTYATVTDLEGQLCKASPSLVIFSLMQGNQATVSTLKVLLDLVPTVPVIVLASVNDMDTARTVLRLGAKGYIPVAKGFEIAVEAVRFCIRGREA
jgi:PleD family two-component response regulator